MPEPEKPLPVSSSEHPTFAPEQEQLFREVLHFMNDSGVPYVVSGTFALHTHTGIWRQTKDLDLFLTPEDANRALELLHRHGFDIYIKDPIWLAKAKRNDHFVDLITGMSNGVLTVDNSWIERSVPATIMGVPSRVLNAEELLASKLFVAFRERFDGADVVHILYGTRGKLDWTRMITLMGEHWEILLWALVFFHYLYPAHAHLVPREVWNTLIYRLQQSLDHPDVRAPFRGSLVDENMFAIDVNEWGLENIIQRYRERNRKNVLVYPADSSAA